MADFRDLVSKGVVACDPYESVLPTDPRWVDLDANQVRGQICCAKTLADTIEIYEKQGQTAELLFSGFIGSGKTTTLFQLKKKLEGDGFFIVFVQAVDYLGTTGPIEPYEVILTVAAEFDRVVDWPGKTAGAYWKRFRAFLDTELNATEASIHLPGDAEITVEFKGNPDFRARIKDLIERRQQQSAVIRQGKDYIVEAMAHLKKERGGEQRVVVIVDDIEKIRGYAATEADVRRGMIRVFDEYGPQLHLPCHTIYTVPPWIRFVEEGKNIRGKFHECLVLPMCKVGFDDRDEPYPQGLDAMARLLRNRVEVDAIFGDGAGDLLTRMAILSGGYPRDLLLLMRGVLTRVYVNAENGPPSAADVNDYLDEVAEGLADDYARSVFEEDMDKLMQIVERHDIPDKLIATERLAKLLENHFVFYYRNRHDWYDLHPLLKNKSRRFARLRDEWQKRQTKPDAT